jgi:hypothetical protein
MGLAKVAVQCSASTFVGKIATFAKPKNVSVMPEQYDSKKNSCETGKYFVN